MVSSVNRSLPSFDDPAGSKDPVWEGPRALRTATKNAPGFYRTRGKRIFDIALSSVMLLAAAPIFLLVMGLIVVFGGGSPIFAHTRVGRSGQPFKCLKFRSMCPDAEERLAAILAADPAAAAEWATDAKLTEDPRVTRLGRFLRKSSLDELPQLINILRGEMSLVGPRPVTLDELDRYGAARTSYLAMKPGLTGPWQVDGRNDISYAGRVALDVGYARDVTFRRDFGIVLRTGLSVLKLTGK